MREDSPQWQELGQPATPAEAEALGAIKVLLPDGALVWAWSNLSFISVNGRQAEVDLLLLTRSGLVVVELKGMHGRIAGNQRHWLLNGKREMDNPVHLTNDKAKWLRGLLEYIQGNQRKVRLPFVRAITVLHGRDCQVDLDDVAKSHTYGLDGFNVQGVPLFSEFLNQPVKDQRDLIDKARARELVKLLATAGFTAPARVRMVGQYAVDRAEPGDQGASWIDVIAEHPQLAGQRKRIRLYDIPRGASEERRQQITRAAQREFLLTSGLKHPGVVAPDDFFDDPQAGPALVFAYDDKAQRLDRWLATAGDDLTLDRRLDVVRQIAEILRYAHGRAVTHRALTPRQIYVTVSKGHPLRVSIRDWQTGREAPGTVTGTSGPPATVLQGTRHVADMAVQDTWVYLAPEVHNLTEPDGVALDVYGLGALTYLLLTLAPPATSMADLEQRIRESQGLDPGNDLDGIPEALRQLVMRATHPDARVDRTPDVATFLADLDEAERQLHEGADLEPALDPLEAQAGCVLDDRFIVQARLGSGSTGLALLVNDMGSADSDKETVLKIAHDASKAQRLQVEFDALAALDHPRIVKPIGVPFDLTGRRCLQLEDAGRPTLGTRIREEGRLTLDQLERYGADLLEAAAHLESRGVLQRDIKPDNLGVRPDPGDRRPRIVLFDFSLSKEPLEHIKAGTPPYLDPFLGGGRRPRYDRSAERFAIAVTLFEMATGQKPVWGSGDADPATITDEVNLGPTLFEPSVATGMMSFFRKALARDSGQRHGDLAELAQAWAEMFRAADAAAPVTIVDEDEEQQPADVAVTLATALTDAGFSARALSALARLEVDTVGELLAVSPFKINSISGIGEKTRREIQRRLRTWRRTMLADQPDPVAEEGDALVLARGLDALVTAFSARRTTKNHAQVRTAEILLGIDTAAVTSEAQQALDAWPNLSEVARVLGVTRPRVSQIVEDLRGTWSKTAEGTGLAEEVESIVSALGGIAEAGEIARALLATHGSAAAEPQRSRQAVGIVRAIVESDLARGGDSRFASRRIGATAVIALEPSDPQAPPADLSLDYARQLVDVADRLAARSTVALRAEALDALRAINGPDGVPPLPDERVLQIAAAASKTAAKGNRGEIYAIGLDAIVALRMTLTGAAVARLHLTPSTLSQRVVARFPDAAPLPDRPTLDRLVAEVDATLRWDGTAYVAPTAATGGLLLTQHALTMQGAPSEIIPFDEVDVRLTSSLHSAGYLTLTVDPRLMDLAAAVLTAAYGLTRVNLTDELIAAVKAYANEKDVDWTFLLKVDAADINTSDRLQLDGFVREALVARLPAVLDQASPLLLTDAAPLGRYGQAQWLTVLTDLATPRPAARWHLVPHRGSGGAPTLDNHVTVPLGADGWLPITADFLATKQHATSTEQAS